MSVGKNNVKMIKKKKFTLKFWCREDEHLVKGNWFSSTFLDCCGCLKVTTSCHTDCSAAKTKGCPLEFGAELSTKVYYKGDNVLRYLCTLCAPMCMSSIPQHCCWPLCSWQGGGTEGLGRTGLLEGEDGFGVAPWSSLSLWCGPIHPKKTERRRLRGRTQLQIKWTYLLSGFKHKKDWTASCSTIHCSKKCNFYFISVSHLTIWNNI